MKKLTLLIVLLLAFDFGYGQTMLAQFDFENPGGYTSIIPEYTDYVSPATGSDGRDFFIRTDGSNTRAEIYTNIQGSYYFTAQDIDGEGATLPVSLLFNNINISGYSSLEFRVHLAEDDVPNPADMHWDVLDFVHFNYDIDNTGTFTELLWIENDGSTFNSAPFIDTNYDGTGDGIEITNTFSQFIQNITSTGSLIDIEIIFSLDAADEDIAIDNIEIWGTLIPCGAPVTWNGSVWSNGTGPDINTSATINGNYDTNIDGNINACSLTINPTFKLRVNDGNFVEVQNDVIVDGELTVTTQGNFIQNNDSAIFTDNSTNGVLVSKTKTVANKFVYTYWSSPIVNEVIEDVFFSVPADKRHSFNATNFVDMLAEDSNTGIFFATPGVDDIDDDGNDWEYAVTGTLQPGVGYAMRTNTFGPAFPRPETFDFYGTFNNGIVSVPLVNNSGGLYNDWNLIGNPYPCAIDADQFFTVNAGLVDAIYLWDQFTAPSNTTGGSEGYNFSGADYAMINGAGGVSGGASGTIPNRFVPSSQGFFVEALNTGFVTFNNSMRAFTNDNSQFFRSTSTKSKKNNINHINKLWINLTSDNGAFNQILISYIDGASISNDGSFYDLKKPVSTGSKVLFYSLIENDTEKFAIQGKGPTSLNENENIKLGFETIINTATLYKFSIQQLEGDFLTNNHVYIKDNLLNTLHNLSDSDYTFTSEVGEFNERFEIVFNANALSTEDIDARSHTLRIVELEDDNVQFTTSNSIKSIRIFDLLGRQLYDFKGRSNSETYNLSNLSSTVYIAKVELSNGAIITKKAIKK